MTIVGGRAARRRRVRVRCEPYVIQTETTARRPDVAVTCVLADAHPAVLEALSRLLKAHGVNIVATASDAVAALDAIRLFEPRVAIIDMRIDRLSSFEITRSVGSKTAVILYASYRDRMSLPDALDAKEAPLDDLATAVRTVVSGRIHLDPLLAGVVAASELKALTSRERAVLRLLADGHRRSATPLPDRRARRFLAASQHDGAGDCPESNRREDRHVAHENVLRLLPQTSAVQQQHVANDAEDNERDRHRQRM